MTEVPNHLLPIHPHVAGDLAAQPCNDGEGQGVLAAKSVNGKGDNPLRRVDLGYLWHPQQAFWPFPCARTHFP